MARLTAEQRKRLSDRLYALQGRRYPIPDVEHARLALELGSKYATPEEYAQIQKAVAKRYPGIKQSRQLSKIKGTQYA